MQKVLFDYEPSCTNDEINKLSKDSLWSLQQHLEDWPATNSEQFYADINGLDFFHFFVMMQKIETWRRLSWITALLPSG